MKKLLALISCIVICSICVIPVNANAYPILSDWAKEEAYLAEANDLFPGGEMHDDLRCAASRGQAAWYAVLLAETLLGKCCIGCFLGYVQFLFQKHSG